MKPAIHTNHQPNPKNVFGLDDNGANPLNREKIVFR